MAFGIKKLDKWLSQQITTDPRSDTYGLTQVQYGVNFQNYPFKLYFVSSNAPLITYQSKSLPSDGSVVNNVIMNVSINEGFVYDLSRYKNQKRDPLYITKRKNGKYIAIGLDGKEELSEDQLDSFKVPVTINGQEMKQVTGAGETGPIIPVILKMNGESVDVNEPPENCCIYLQIFFQDTSELGEGETAGIDAADILTGVQLKEKYPDIKFFLSDSVELPGQFNNTRFLKIYDGSNCRYVCTNSADSLLTKTFVNPSTYSEELKRKRAQDLSGGQFSFIFQPRPQFYKTLRNHLFLRIS